MEPAGPSAKKLKLAASELQEAAPSPAAVAAEATDPKPPVATEGRHEPPPGAEEESMDRITNLPDAVLEEIISLLPTNEGARTQALASRWRHLWHSAPLNLDLRYLPDDVSPGAILSAHQGHGRRLCLPPLHVLYRAADLDDWIRSPALDNLQELEIYASYPIPPQLSSPPASIFRFSSTLRVATIAYCNLPDEMVETLRFPQLRKLALVHVEVSEASLQSIVTSCCSGLECFLLGIYVIRCLRINSPTIRSIGIRSISGQLVIEDAPSLERLLHLTTRTSVQISVISAPKLETLGCISDSYWGSKIVFGNTIIEVLRIGSLTTMVHTVKILAIHISCSNLDTVIDLMRCFPCLEKLYMKRSTSWGEGANLWRRKHRNLLRSLDIRLKTIVLGYYRGIRSQVSFATFFVLNARVLESIRLEVHADNYNEDFFAAQHEMLEMEKRASRGARLRFTKDCSHDASDIVHVSDLDLADPFSCVC